jgi:hypothetical protein
VSLHCRLEEAACAARMQLRQKLDQKAGNTESGDHVWELVFDLEKNQIYIEHSYIDRMGHETSLRERVEINEYLKLGFDGSGRLREMLLAVFWQ